MKTVSELAKELNVNRTTLHRLIQRNKIETLQEGNKRLIDATAEQAIKGAFQSKSLQGETLQKHCKNDAETLQRNNIETDYIQSLLVQIAELKADKEFLQSQLVAKDNQLTEKDNQIKTLTAEIEQERKERQTILAELLQLRGQKRIEVKAEPRPTGAAQRQQERPHKKLSLMDKLRAAADIFKR